MFDRGTEKPDEGEDTNTFSYQEHKPCGFMLNMVNAVDNTNYEFMYRGKDAVDVFCQKLNEIRAEVKEKMGANEKMDMADEDKEDFTNAKNFFICGDKFRMNYKNAKEAEKHRKARDHCHFTGKCRGCAHNVCNLNYCSRYLRNGQKKLVRSLQGGERRLTKLGKGFFRDKYYEYLAHVPAIIRGSGAAGGTPARATSAGTGCR